MSAQTTKTANKSDQLAIKGPAFPAPRSGLRETADHDRSSREGTPGVPAWTPYMDESGSAGDREGHYVLGCLVGRPTEIARAVDRLYCLKLGMVPDKDPNPWEIHSNRIMTGHSPTRARTEQKKLAVMEAIVETICRPDMAIFGVAVANGPVNRRESGASLHHALTFILERLELFLRVKGEEETGRIISDMMRRGTRERASRVFASTAHGHNRLCHVRTGRIRAWSMPAR